jgi:hypothetical protein
MRTEQEQREVNDEERAEQLRGELHCQTEKLRGASKEVTDHRENGQIKGF